MVDFSPVQEEFNEAVEIRKELNGTHWKDYEALKQVFAAIFSEEPNVLKTISDMNYYKGGYPGEDSPPKLDALFWKVGTIIKYFALVGRLDDLNGILFPYGFKLVEGDVPNRVIPMNKKALGESKKIEKAHEKLLERFDFRWTDDPKEMVEWFLDTTERLQSVICSRADEIKIDLFDKVEEKLEGQIDKSGFNTAVNVVANKQLKEEAKKDVGNLVEKALEKSETLTNNGEFLREKVSA